MARRAADVLAHPVDRRAPRHGEAPLDVRLDLGAQAQHEPARRVALEVVGGHGQRHRRAGERDGDRRPDLRAGRSPGRPTAAGGRGRGRPPTPTHRRSRGPPGPGRWRDVVDPGGQQRGVEEHGCRACPTGVPLARPGAESVGSAPSGRQRRRPGREVAVAELAPLLADLRRRGGRPGRGRRRARGHGLARPDPGRGLDRRPPDRPPRVDRRAGAARARPTRRGSPARSPTPVRPWPPPSTRPRHAGATDAPERLLARWREGRTALAEQLAALPEGPGCRGSARR